MSIVYACGMRCPVPDISRAAATARSRALTRLSEGKIVYRYARSNRFRLQIDSRSHAMSKHLVDGCSLHEKVFLTRKCFAGFVHCISRCPAQSLQCPTDATCTDLPRGTA
eukprot:1658145-Rhodomonas_salina.3